MKQMDFASLSYEKKAQKKDLSQGNFLSQIINRAVIYLCQRPAQLLQLFLHAAEAEGTSHRSHR